MTEKDIERKRILLKEKRKSISSKIFELRKQYDYKANEAKTMKADIEDIVSKDAINRLAYFSLAENLIY